MYETSKIYLPSPSLANATLEVEKAKCLGLEDIFNDCWSKEERRTVVNVRREQCDETLEKDRGMARVKLLKESILRLVLMIIQVSRSV